MAESVLVAVRVRPLNSKEKAAKDTEIQQNTKTSITITNPTKKESKSFTFDYVYGTSSIQENLYNDLGKLYLENAWAGFNCTLFAYGQTGSGKSYSMTGNMTPEDQKGIIPRGCQEMFDRITNTEDSNVSYAVRVSYLEIYNEKLQDLLDPKTVKTINIRESPTKGIYVENVVEQPVASYKEIDKVLADGNKVRTTAATAMNATSSRSHSVLTIFFTRNEIISGKKTQKDSQINLVDLAGSERQSQTEASGDRLTEACAINKSLSALGNVIAALVDVAKGKSTFVPYRDSILTRMLQDSLGGNSKTIMIAAVSPASSNYDETLSTLQYADRAKQIKNKPTVNESETDKLIKELKAEIERLKAEIQAQNSGSSSSGSASGSSSGSGIVGMSPEEEEEFRKKQAEYEAEIESKRAEIAQQQELAAQKEAELAEKKAALDAQLSELEQQKAQQAQNAAQSAQNAKEQEELKKKIASLEQQQKAIEAEIQKQNNADEGLAAKQAEADQLRESREQTLADLAAIMNQLDNLTMTAEQRKKKADAIKKQREEYLSDLGLSSAEAGDLAGTEKDGPQLRNISVDRDLSGNLVYYIPAGSTGIGSVKPKDGVAAKLPSAQCDKFILIRGLGVKQAHCCIKYNKTSSGEKVTIQVYPPIQGTKDNIDPYIVINGVKLTSAKGQQELFHYDRIIIGRNIIFRFQFDRKQALNPSKNKLLSEDDELLALEAELAVARGQVMSVEDWNNKDKTQQALVDADKFIDEANALAKRMGRRIDYSLDIGEDKKQINVNVVSHEISKVQIWPISKLEGRIPIMHYLVKDFIDDGVLNGTQGPVPVTTEAAAAHISNDDKQTNVGTGKYYGTQEELADDYTATDVALRAAEQDPFFDPPGDILVGIAGVQLQNVLVLGQMNVFTCSIKRKDKIPNNNGGFDQVEKLFGDVSLKMHVTVKSDGSDSNTTSNTTEQVASPSNTAQTTSINAQRQNARRLIKKKETVPIKKIRLTRGIFLEREVDSASNSTEQLIVKKQRRAVRIRTQLTVDPQSLYGKDVQITMDIVSCAFNSDAPSTKGVQIKFNSPTVGKEWTRRKWKPNTELISKLRRKRKSQSGASVSGKQEYLLKESFTFEFPNFNETQYNQLSQQILNLEVWAHPEKYSVLDELRGPTAGSNSNLPPDMMKVQLSVLAEQEIQKAAKNSLSVQSREAEVQKMRDELNELIKKHEELKGQSKSSSCIIL